MIEIIQYGTVKRNNDLNDITVHSNEWLEYTDLFGRRWKLEPIKNENIMMPFRIIPLPKET